jgi:MoaA/NifB/PqqE/SkfB family radical SAM enzyme
MSDTPSEPQPDVPYHAQLHWMVTAACNLSCPYCLSTPWRGIKAPKKNAASRSKYHEDLKILAKEILSSDFSFLLHVIRAGVRKVLLKQVVERIDIPQLMKALDKTGMTFKITLTGGGEPFLVPNFVEACRALSKKHYLSVLTNLTSDKAREFAQTVDPVRVVDILAAAHLLELQKRGLMENFIRNFLMCRQRGFSIRAVAVAYPPLLPKMDYYKQYFEDRGIALEFVPFYKSCRDQADSEAGKEKVISDSVPEDRWVMKPLASKGRHCHAGYNIGAVTPQGIIRPCFSMDGSLGNIYGNIRFSKCMMKCPAPVCICPF